MEYNHVQIGNLHLTSDGTDLGAACRVDIPSLARLRPKYRRTVIMPIEGSPVVQLFENLIGEVIQMTVFLLNSEEYEDLIEIIDAADESNGIINIKLSDGDLGEFDVDCLLESFDQPSGEFVDGRIEGLTMTWRVAAVNEEEEEEE